MLKIKDKVRVMRKNESNQWAEIGKGVIRDIYVNNIGENTFVSYVDKEWTNPEVTEILPIDSECLKVVKF